MRFHILFAWCCLAWGWPGSEALAEPSLRISTTTAILADVVRAVGGDAVQVESIIPANTDPHVFEPSPRDAASLKKANLIIENGAGLDDFITTWAERLGGGLPIIDASAGLPLREMAEDEDADHEHGHDHADEEEHHHHDHHGVDPHVWLDPLLVSRWVDNIVPALSRLAPEQAATFAAQGQAYQAKLAELHAWIEKSVAALPPERRRIITDHQTFGYFAARYGFSAEEAILPGFSTGAEPSARELAQLADSIQEHRVPAIFINATINSAVAERLARDTGVRLVPLTTCALAGPGGEVISYIDFMRQITDAIVNNLK